MCEGNSPVTGEIPAQRASNTENVSIWWRHHVYCLLPSSVSFRPGSSQSCGGPAVYKPSSRVSTGTHISPDRLGSGCVIVNRYAATSVTSHDVISGEHVGTSGLAPSVDQTRRVRERMAAGDRGIISMICGMDSRSWMGNLTMAKSQENSFRIIGHLWWDPTDHWRIPLTKVQLRCFLYG